MAEHMSLSNFAGKVEWEGGVLEALDYGLKHTDIDPDDPRAAPLRTAWAELEELYAPVRTKVQAVEDMLEDIPDELDDTDED